MAQNNIEVGDYFEAIWSAVTRSSRPVIVNKVITQSKVEIRSENGNCLLTITKRKDGIWREVGKTKQVGSGRECGTRYIYSGKVKPEKFDSNPDGNWD